MDSSSYVTNSDWDLVGSEFTRNSVHYDCCPEPYISKFSAVTLLLFTVALGLAASLHLKRRSEEFWTRHIIPNYLFTFICLLGGLIPASAPLPRLTVLSLMILLVLLTVPPQLPPVSLLTTIVTQNLALEIFLLTQTVIVISLNHCCLNMSNAVRIIKIVDLVILAILFFTFVILSSLSILSAPILS